MHSISLLPESLRYDPSPAETLLRVSMLLNAELDLDRLVARLTDEATALCGAAFGALFYNVEDRDRGSYTLYTLSGAPREAFAKFPMPRNTEVFAPTFRGDGVVRSDDITKDPRYGRNAPHRGMPEGHLPVRSYLAVPVVSRAGEVLGGLFFGHPEAGRFNDVHETLIRGLAAHASVAIDNARLYQKARQAEDRARGAHEVEARRAREAGLRADVGAAITRGGVLRGTLQRCAEAIVERLGVAFARVWTLDPRGEWLELQASAGMYTHIHGPHARVPVGTLKIGRIAQERVPHLTNNVQEDPRVGDHEWARREGMVAFAGYPMILHRRLLGVVAVFAKEPLAQDVLDLLASVADLLALGVDRDRAEAHASQEQSRREDQLRALVENLPELAWAARPDGHIDYYNRRWYEYTGTRFEEVEGWGWERVHDPKVLPEVLERWRRSLETGEAFEMEYPLRGADGTFQWFLTRVNPMRDADGDVVRWFGTCTNIEVLKRAQAERDQLIAALAATNAELDQFAYVASHDLKAPLRAIANLSQWIEEDLGADNLPGDTRTNLNLLRGRVQRLEKLIDGILSYSRAGRVRDAVERVSVGALLKEVFELLAPAPPASVTVQGEMPTVLAERVPLQQVFMNLIGNALKHGGPDVRVEVSVADAGTHWEFSVKDDGPGIEPEFHERVWGIFQTLERRDRVEGTGIGLSVVRKVVETRGGRAWLRSAPGAGATFSFTWRKTPSTESGRPLRM